MSRNLTFAIYCRQNVTFNVTDFDKENNDVSVWNFLSIGLAASTAVACFTAALFAACYFFRKQKQTSLSALQDNPSETQQLRRSPAVRASTRSTCSQSKQPAIFFTRVSMLRSIKESPEGCDFVTIHDGQPRNSINSLSSVFTHLTPNNLEINNVLSNSAMYPTPLLSADIERPSILSFKGQELEHEVKSLAQSFPELFGRSAQSAQRKAYRLAWLTPISAQSAPVLFEHRAPAAAACQLTQQLFPTQDLLRNPLVDDVSKEFQITTNKGATIDLKLKFYCNKTQCYIFCKKLGVN